MSKSLLDFKKKKEEGEINQMDSGLLNSTQTKNLTKNSTKN